MTRRRGAREEVRFDSYYFPHAEIHDPTFAGSIYSDRNKMVGSSTLYVLYRTHVPDPSEKKAISND